MSSTRETTCEQVRGQLAAALEGTLSELSPEVRDHVSRCEECARRLETLDLPARATAAPVGHAPEGSMGEALADAHRLGTTMRWPAGRFLRWLAGTDVKSRGALRWGLALLAVGFLLAWSLTERPPAFTRCDHDRPATPDGLTISALRDVEMLGQDPLFGPFGQALRGVIPGDWRDTREADARRLLGGVCQIYESRGLHRAWPEAFARTVAGRLAPLVASLESRRAPPGVWVALLRFAGLGGDSRHLDEARRRILERLVQSPPPDPIARLTVCQLAVRLRGVPEPLERALCLEGLEARWELVKSGQLFERVSWLLPGDPWSGHCRRCRALDKAEPNSGCAGDWLHLARLRFLHHQERDGTAAAWISMLDRQWWIPGTAAWLREGEALLPAVALGLLVWVLLASWFARRELACSWVPARGMPLGWILAGAGLVTCVVLVFSETGGLAWTALATLDGNPLRMDNPVLNRCACFANWLRGGRAAVVVEGFRLLSLALVPATLFFWIVKASPPARGRLLEAIVAPVVVVALFASPPEHERIAVEAPLVIGLCLVVAGRRLIPHSPLFGSLALWAMSLSMSNSFSHTISRQGHGLDAGPGILGLVSVALPLWVGFELMHLPPARVERRRAIVAAVLAVGCLAAVPAVVRAELIQALASAAPGSHAASRWSVASGASRLDLVILCLGFLAPWCSLRLGALLAPDGAAALGGVVPRVPPAMPARLCERVLANGLFLVLWLAIWAAAGACLPGWLSER